MKFNEFDSLVKKEKRRITRELKRAGISEHKMKALEGIIANTSLMKVKLDQARDQIKDQGLIIEYHNGGGQKGTRINPALKAFGELWRSYFLGIDRILSIIPEDDGEKVEIAAGEISVLEFVRRKKENE